MPAVSASHTAQALVARSTAAERTRVAKIILTVISATLAFILCTFALLEMLVICYSCVERRGPRRQSWLTSKNWLVLLFTWPYHVYRFFQLVKQRKSDNAKKNKDIEVGVKGVDVGSSPESGLRSMPASHSVVELEAYDRLASLSQPGPANESTTPQHLHLQPPMQHSEMEPAVLASARLARPYEQTYAVPSAPIVHSAGRPLLVSVPSHKAAMHRSADSPMEPHSGCFSDERNDVGGENIDYLNNEGQWFKGEKAASIPLPASPESDGRNSFDSEGFHNVPL